MTIEEAADKLCFEIISDPEYRSIYFTKDKIVIMAKRNIYQKYIDEGYYGYKVEVDLPKSKSDFKMF